MGVIIRTANRPGWMGSQAYGGRTEKGRLDVHPSHRTAHGGRTDWNLTIDFRGSVKDIAKRWWRRTSRQVDRKDRECATGK